MAWFAIVDGSGALVSTGTVIADEAELAARGLRALPIDIDPTGKVWDETALTFIDPPAPTVTLPRMDFIQRFTALEFMAVRKSDDPMVQFLFYQLDRTDHVQVSSHAIQEGLQYLVGVGILTAQRAAEIGRA